MRVKKLAAVAGTLVVFALAGCGSGGDTTGNSGGGMGNMDMSNGTEDTGNQANSTK